MLVSEIIKKLQEVEDEHGPLEMVISEEMCDFEVFLLRSEKEKCIIIKKCNEKRNNKKMS